MSSVEAGKVIRVRQHIGPAGDGGIAISSPEVAACCLYRSETGRARCVDAQTGA